MLLAGKKLSVVLRIKKIYRKEVEIIEIGEITAFSRKEALEKAKSMRSEIRQLIGNDGIITTISVLSLNGKVPKWLMKMSRKERERKGIFLRYKIKVIRMTWEYEEVSDPLPSR